MEDPNQQMNDNGGLSAALSGQITVAAVVLIFIIFIIFIVLFLYLRAKVYSDIIGSSRSRRLVFAPHEPTLPRHALDPSILNSLPVTIFKLKDFEEESCLECAVCLCELEDGEHVRLLPECSHGFHVECIDMWFHSNNTCPLCRSLINGDTISTSTETSVEIPTEPLVAGLETGNSSKNLNEGSSSCAGTSSAAAAASRRRKEGMLVIDIPTRVAEAFSPLPTSRLLEEFKSPDFRRLKSFKRNLSRGKASFKGESSSYSPIGCDIEQGGLLILKCQ